MADPEMPGRAARAPPEPSPYDPVSPPMAELAIHPPVILRTHPDEPIRSLEAAAKVVERHAGDQPDRTTEGLLRRLGSVSSPEEADAVGRAFRAWAEQHGLLLVPSEDHKARSGR